jgi:hypothetical protein
VIITDRVWAQVPTQEAQESNWQESKISVSLR